MSGSLTPGLESLTGKFFSTSSKTITGTSETSIIPPGVGDLIVPGNWFQPGYNLRIVARGTVTTPLVSGTTNIKIKLNGTTVVSAVSTSLLGSLVGQYFRVICNIQCYSIGTNGVLAAAGEIGYPSGLAGVQQGNQPLNNANIAIDTTQPINLDVTAQWNLTAHSLTTTIFTFEAMRMY
jgi:hypothetical protein